MNINVWLIFFVVIDCVYINMVNSDIYKIVYLGFLWVIKELSKLLLIYLWG